MERTTGYQTSSVCASFFARRGRKAADEGVDCDPELKKTFHGECEGNPFFVKVSSTLAKLAVRRLIWRGQTHFPTLGWNDNARQYYKGFDQAVHVG